MLRVLHVLFWAWMLSFPANAAGRTPTTHQRLDQLQQQLGQLNSDLTVVKDDHERLIALSKSIAALEAAKNDTTEHDRLLVQSKGLTDLEKRLEDNHQSITSWRATFSNLITLFGALFTALVIYFSWRAVNEAKVTAQLAAREEVKNWTDNNGEAEVKKWMTKNSLVLQQVLKKMQLQGEKMLADIIRQGDKTLEKIENQVAIANKPKSPPPPLQKHDSESSIREPQLKVVEINSGTDQSPTLARTPIIETPDINIDADETEALLNRLSASEGLRGDAIEKEDQLALKRTARSLRATPESQYAFNDWRILYFESANREAWNLANRYLDGMKQTSTDDWQEAITKSSQALLLDGLNQYAGAIKLWDEIIKQYGASNDPRLIKRVAAAMVGKGHTIKRQNLRATEFSTFEPTASGYSEDPASGIVEQLAKTLTVKGDELSAQGRWTEAIATYDEAVSRYQSYSEAPVATQLARAMLNKGYVLCRQNQWSAALALYDQVTQTYGDRPEAAIKALAVRALAGKGYVMSQQGRNEAAIDAFDETAVLYGDCKEAVVAVQVAKALFNKGCLLSQQRRWIAALSVYDELERRYSGYSEASVLELLAKAKSNRVFALSKLP